MDSLTWFELFTARKRNLWLFSLFFLFPLVGNLISRLTKARYWLPDFDALICGAHNVSRGISPYSLHPVCDGIRPTPYVYAPQVGQFFAPLEQVFGLEGARWAFALVYMPAMLWLFWYAILKPMDKAPWHFRLMTLAAMVGSVLSCGNIGLLLHALTILGALYISKSRLPFIAIVICGALIKPVFLTYLVVLLLEDRPLIARLRTFLLSATVAVSALLALLLTAGRFSDDWHAALNAIVILEQPGIGFFATTSALGLNTASAVTLIGLGVFITGMGLASLVLAEWGGLTAEERIIFGLGAAQFLNPRLMDYDMFTLAPCMAMVVMTAKPLGQKTFTCVSWAFAGTLIFCVVCNILEIRAIHRAPVAVFAYGLILLAVAGLTAWPQRMRIRDWFRNPLPILQDILAQRI
ncbi:hypothetical protein [Asticcacaulis taihuensis]|uniref:DUF2029 domain-containing protein n=1 Tax=Asticcacaulis taihuensis TaxID=260084 RepID=A0A1G4S3K7_9CAUL|nr:hypothetical protein [Asticcacaulis taihuensis]SCW63852.1 hypothetical protein SAMN02927928_2406 [Asticcacaulis taihuensis]